MKTRLQLPAAFLAFAIFCSQTHAEQTISDDLVITGTLDVIGDVINLGGNATTPAFALELPIGVQGISFLGTAGSETGFTWIFETQNKVAMKLTQEGVLTLGDTGNLVTLSVVSGNLKVNNHPLVFADSVTSPSFVSLSTGGGTATGLNSAGLAGGNASGANGFAAGLSATASGANSIALGASASAVNTASIAIGRSSVAAGASYAPAIAIGDAAQASAWSLALGRNAYATSGGVVVGNDVEAGQGGVAVGSNVYVYGDQANGLGRMQWISGRESTAIGIWNWTSGVGSAVVGNGSGTDGYYSYAFGAALQANGPFQTVLGAYNQPQGSTSSQEPSPSDLIFMVGNGDSTATSNALTIRKDAGTAIGTGVASKAASQFVAGKYNDLRTADGTIDHTVGVFVVGAGANTNTRSNALRVLDDGTVLVKPSGDLGMGDFAAGPTP